MPMLQKIRDFTSMRIARLTHRQVSFLLLLLYFVLSIVRMRTYLESGRFWGEEGKIFYADISGSSWIQGLTYLFHGHLELTTNFLVFLSTLVSFEHAPLVTTFGSLLIQSIPVAFVVVHRDHFAKHWFGIVLFMSVLLALRQSSEVWANSINLHFHFALLASLIVCRPVSGEKADWTGRVLLLISGLSGIPANFLTPIYLFVAYRERTRERIIQALILTTTTLLQLVLVLFNQISSEGRFIPVSPLTLWSGILSHQWISPLPWADMGRYLVALMSGLPESGFEGWLVLAIGTSLYALLIIHAARTRSSASLWLIACSLLLAVASAYTSLGDKAQLVSLYAGGRYFYASNCLLFLAWIGTLRDYRNPALGVAFLILIAVMWKRSSLSSGEPWKAALREASQNNSENVEIWPHGWEMKRPR